MHRSAVLVVLLSLLVLTMPTIVPSPASAQPGGPPASPIVPGEVLVKFQPGTPGQEIAEAHRQQGGQVKATIPRIDVQVVEVARGQEGPAAQAYAHNPNVVYAEPNRVYRVSTHGAAYPNDPRFDQQWQYRTSTDADLDAFEAWNNTGGTRGDASVAVGILDTGIAQSHEDLQVAQSVNFTTSPTVDDRYGHGTHVAGSAAAKTNNGVGVSGTCPECSLYNVKVMGDDGSGQWDWIANGIIWAADHGAEVISMSLGGYSGSQTLQDAVTYAWGKGAVLTAAAGNDGQNWGSYPGVYSEVIAVAATDQNDQRASFSNWGGNWVDVAAPGQDILSTAPNSGSRIWPAGTDGYGIISGTSMATPHVAGVAGLVWSATKADSTKLCADNTCVRNRIESTADPIGGTGTAWGDFTAHGRVNARASVGASTESATPALPTLAINDVSVTEGNSSTTSAIFTVSLSAASQQEVSVSYATTNGTASAGSDYTAVPATTLTFAPGETTKTISVAVLGDTVDEPDETFVVNLSNAVNATIADSQGQATIIDDDIAAAPTAPTLSIGDASVTEGHRRRANATFTVTLSATSSQTVTVAYATADGTATLANSDYVSKSGTLTFNAGETSKSIVVRVNGDTRMESDETFLVNLSNPTNATLGDSQGLGTILNDD